MPPRSMDGSLLSRLVEALVHVVVHMDVDVLGDASAAVAKEAGDVLDAQARLRQGPGGEDVAQAVEGPGPAASGRSWPSRRDGCWVPGVAAVVGATGPPASGGGEDEAVELDLVQPALDAIAISQATCMM